MKNSINILGLNITFYSLCILLGVIIAYIIITRESKKNKIDSKVMDDIIFYGLLCGIVGARLYYVIFNYNYYFNNIDEIIKVWHGGLAIHGGIIFGSIFVYIYSKRKNINFIKLTDIILPGVLIAQAIGRWGNFFNQEAYGIMVSKELLNKLLIPNFVIKGMFIDNNYYLPTFYIESIFCLIGFIIIIILRKKFKLKEGFITSFYLIWYGLLRLIIEYFRLDSLMIGPFKMAMIVSLISIILGIILFIYKRKEKE